MSHIPLTRPHLGPEELNAIADVIGTGQLVSGPKVAAFEKELCTRFNYKHAVAVNTGTTALFLSLKALDIGPGDEVIVPDFCFPSVAAAVLQVGAECVLCDVDVATYNLNLESLESVVTSRTAAVIAVHQFGLSCGIEKVRSVVSVPIVEDAACALGAKDNGALCGGLGDLGCVSFHPRKIITTAEGGLITTRNLDISERCRWLRSHGIHMSGGRVVFEELGYGARMSDIHAAIGLAQLDRFDGIVSGRLRAANWYRERLSEIDGIETSDMTWSSERVYQSLVVNLRSGIDRDKVVRSLRALGIESTIGTYAIHRQKPFSGCRVPKQGLNGSVSAAERSISLPLWSEMPENDVDQVVSALRGLVL